VWAICRVCLKFGFDLVGGGWGVVVVEGVVV